VAKLEDTANDLQNQINALSRQLTKTLADLETARKDTAYLKDESTAELEENIRNVDELNRQIRANLEREKAELDAESYLKQYDELTESIEDVRKQKSDLLNGADMPLPELSVKDCELTYNGYQWDSMSGSEQLKTATAIVRKLNPKCGFVLLDKLEQMDNDTLNEFGEWLESEGLQAIATRVSTGNECSVIIEDGYVKEENVKPIEPKKWKAGEF
jgi:DNA repair exonuclease SbcCD ATPase subunit